MSEKLTIAECGECAKLGQFLDGIDGPKGELWQNTSDAEIAIELLRAAEAHRAELCRILECEPAESWSVVIDLARNLMKRYDYHRARLAAILQTVSDAPWELLLNLAVETKDALDDLRQPPSERR